MIDVDEIIQKYAKNEDDEEAPTSEELGIDRSDWQEPAEELVEELRKIGADLDWWMGNKTRHEAGVMELGPDPPEVSVEEVCELVDLDYNLLMRFVNDKMDENLGTILGTIGEEEKDTIEGAVEELRKDTSILGQMKAAGKLAGIATYLKSQDPRNKPLWVALLLKEHGEEEVSVRRWFRAHWLFDRVLKAETARRAGGMIDSIKDMFRGE